MDKYLDKNTERKLVALGNKRYYRALILTALWMLFVLVAFVVFMLTDHRDFSVLRNYILLVFCILPFFPFSAHKILFSKSFYATVAYSVHSNQFEVLKPAGVKDRFATVAVLEVTYRKDNGKKFTLAYKKDKYLVEELHYEEGDRVFFVRGIKYPFEFPFRKGKRYTCPGCGRLIVADEAICGRCHFDFSEYKAK